MTGRTDSSHLSTRLVDPSHDRGRSRRASSYRLSGQTVEADRRRALSLRIFARVPQSSIEHQRRDPFRLRSRKRKPQPPLLHRTGAQVAELDSPQQLDSGGDQPVGNHQRRRGADPEVRDTRRLLPSAPASTARTQPPNAASVVRARIPAVAGNPREQLVRRMHAKPARHKWPRGSRHSPARPSPPTRCTVPNSRDRIRFGPVDKVDPSTPGQQVGGRPQVVTRSTFAGHAGRDSIHQVEGGMPTDDPELVIKTVGHG